MKSVTLYFADDDDARNFEKYRQLALENHGTVTGLYAGLMTSLIRDAKVTENHTPELLDALKALMGRAVIEAEKYTPYGNEPIWAFIEDAADAIAKAER